MPIALVTRDHMLSHAKACWLPGDEDREGSAQRDGHLVPALWMLPALKLRKVIPDTVHSMFLLFKVC